jgi:hypothetical protein
MSRVRIETVTTWPTRSRMYVDLQSCNVYEPTSERRRPRRAASNDS